MTVSMQNLKRALAAGIVSLAMAGTLAGCGCSNGSVSGSSTEGSSSSSSSASQPAEDNMFLGRWVYLDIMPTGDGGAANQECVEVLFAEDKTVKVNPVYLAPMFMEESGTYEVDGKNATVTLDNGKTVPMTINDEGLIETKPEIFGATGDDITLSKTE